MHSVHIALHALGPLPAALLDVSVGETRGAHCRTHVCSGTREIPGFRRASRTGSIYGACWEARTPPKSVSLLWALPDEAISAEVRAAHDAAVHAALEFLQDHAAFTRRGHAGAVQADTDGYVAAAFTHRTSRARDPQLHAHVLVSAKVRASTDGAWLALDGRELFEVQKAAGLVYKAGLRAEMRTRLGVAWGTVDANGGAEMVGVRAGLVEHFSKRRAEVEARAGELMREKKLALGRSLNATEQAAAYQLAAYQSRAAKAKGQETTAQLRARWRHEAIESGYHPDEWVRAALDQPSAAPRPGNGARHSSSRVGGSANERGDLRH